MKIAFKDHRPHDAHGLVERYLTFYNDYNFLDANGNRTMVGLMNNPEPNVYAMLSLLYLSSLPGIWHILINFDCRILDKYVNTQAALII